MKHYWLRPTPQMSKGAALMSSLASAPPSWERTAAVRGKLILMLPHLMPSSNSWYSALEDVSFPHDTYFGILLPCLNWQLLSLQTPNVVEHRHVAATRSPLRAGQKTLDSLSPCTDLIFVTWYCSERCCPTGINEPHSGDLGPWVTLSRSLNYSELLSPCSSAKWES